MDPKVAREEPEDAEETYSSYEYENEDVEDSMQLLSKHIHRLSTLREDIYALNAQQQILVQLSKQIKARIPMTPDNVTGTIVMEEINKLLHEVDQKMQKQSDYYKRNYSGSDRAASSAHLAPVSRQRSGSASSTASTNSQNEEKTPEKTLRTERSGHRVTIVVDEETEAKRAAASSMLSPNSKASNGSSSGTSGTRRLSEKDLKPLKGTLVVKILEARDLCIKNCSAYCVVSLGGTLNHYGTLTKASSTNVMATSIPLQGRTAVIRRTHNPKWTDEEFTFQIDRNTATELVFDMWDTHKLGADKRLGSAKVSLWILLERKNFDSWLKLIPSREKDEGKVTGDLHISLQFYPTKEEHPLFTAIRQSDLAKVEELLADGSVDVNIKDDHGFTPLHEACVLFTENDDEILECLLNNPKINVNVANDDQNTPLHYFCGKYRSPRCSEAFKMFIEKGADVNVQNRNGETPLHKAISNHSLRQMMVTLLIKAGANVNTVNKLNETPLLAAIISTINEANSSKREDVIALLLKAGADINIRGTRANVTALELAQQEGLTSIVEMINRAKDLFEWLDNLGMGQYKQPFLNEEIYKDVLPDLNARTLDRLGVTSPAHRSVIQDAIHRLKQDLAVKQSPKLDVLSKSGGAISASQQQDLEDSFRKMLDVKASTWEIKPSELEFTAKLGDGAFGIVYRGIYKEQPVAIKVLKNYSANDIKEFKQEFQMMSALQCPHIMFFFGACLSPKLCMVLELCGRGSLYHVMNDPLLDFEWKQFFEFSIESLKGIDYLHENGILHRDLKSLNLMITDQWHVKVADFGTARVDSNSMSNTLTQVRGTYWYTAPELYFGERYNTKSDVFSMSVVLWEMIVRCIKRKYERPYLEFPRIKQPYHALIQVSKNAVRNTVPPTCPQELTDLVKTGWEQESFKRPSCKEMLQKLEALYAQFNANPTQWNSAILADEGDNNNNTPTAEKK